MASSQVRVLVLGAHPDDAEFHAGGLMSWHIDQGNVVKIISVTNGASGHHWRSPEDLMQTRRAETQSVSQQHGVLYDVWEFPDGELQPSLDVRRRIIREIREFQPDLVLTHRPFDYHPDHRAVGLAVQDASYMVTVPLVVRDVAALRQDPIVAYMNDLFTKPCPLQPDVVLDIGPYFDRIVAMLACHRSQVFEWLPYNHRVENQMPEGESERIAWLGSWYAPRARAVADRFRVALASFYGGDRGNAVQFAEAYEISEYAGKMTDEQRQRLFPSK